jgi:hypothetical protein
MRLYKTDPNELQNLAENQNYLYLKNNLYRNTVNNKGYQDETEYLTECTKLLERKFDITLDNNSELYDAVIEMIIINELNDMNPSDRYSLNLYPGKIDETIFCIGNMLNKLSSKSDIDKALAAINELMPELSEFTEVAKQCPSFFISYYEDVAKIIDNYKVIAQSQDLVYESRVDYVEHLIEEAASDESLKLKSSMFRELAQFIVKYEKTLEDLAGEKFKLDKNSIKEMILDFNS